MFTEIFVDGHKLHGVRRFELKQEVGNNLPILTVDLNALNLSTDAKMVMYQYGVGMITDISFEGTPDKDFIISRISDIYGIDEGEIRERVFSDWKMNRPSQNP